MDQNTESLLLRSIDTLSTWCRKFKLAHQESYYEIYKIEHNVSITKGLINTLSKKMPISV